MMATATLVEDGNFYDVLLNQGSFELLLFFLNLELEAIQLLRSLRL